MAGDAGEDLSDLITPSGAAESGCKHCSDVVLLFAGDECGESGGDGGALGGAAPGGGPI